MSDLSPRVKVMTVPTPFKVGPVHPYVIAGDPLTLVDAGPKTEEAWQALVAGLAEHGYRVRDIERIILTHAHTDHFGLLRRVVEESDAPVFAHPRCLSWLRDAPHEWEHRAGFFYRLWVQSGVPEERLSRMRFGLAVGAQYAEALLPDMTVYEIDEGAHLTLGSAQWHVLYTPGHSTSHIALYEPQSQQMLSGDHLLLRISSNPLLEPPEPGETRRRSLVEYMASLQRVAAMDISVAWTGHGPPVYGHHALIARRMANTDARKEKIAGLMADRPRTAYQMSEALFPDLPTGELFLGLSEIVGHLDLLELEGRLCVEDHDGVLWYSAGPA
ncbi:MAG: MBL fold metallo-hydrolase [Anaerolineae bacterium]